jgi:hypothetical protein
MAHGDRWKWDGDKLGLTNRELVKPINNRRKGKCHVQQLEKQASSPDSIKCSLEQKTTSGQMKSTKSQLNQQYT